MYAYNVQLMNVTGEESVKVVDLGAAGWTLDIGANPRIAFFADDLDALDALATNARRAVRQAKKAQGTTNSNNTHTTESE